jgi:predicted enzyme related to lactoylglutathione lyase
MHSTWLFTCLMLVACAGPNALKEDGPMVPRLFRVIVPAADVEAAADFYAALLGMPGERVSPGRHYFDCGGTILACFDPKADGDAFDARPNPDHIYIAVSDLDAVFQRARRAGCRKLDAAIETRPWGERSFYCQDPTGNPLCFVDASTTFTSHRKS